MYVHLFLLPTLPLLALSSPSFPPSSFTDAPFLSSFRDLQTDKRSLPGCVRLVSVWVFDVFLSYVLPYASLYDMRLWAWEGEDGKTRGSERARRSVG